MEMQKALINRCTEHADDPFACPDMLVAYSDTFGEYGLIVHDGGPSYLVISACPFCGNRLAASRREEWFDRLESMGVGLPFRPNGAFYALADLRKYTQDSHAFAFDLLEKAGVAVTPGIDFGHGTEGFIRFSFAASAQQIEEGLRRIAFWLNEIAR